MATLISSTRQHLLWHEVETMISERCGSGEEISDAAALTIASWWQTPSGPGAVFAQFASTGRVDYHALQAAIAADYDEAQRQGPGIARQLDMLATWAMNHPSRQLDRSAVYVAGNPIPPHLIRPGMRVAVPLWIKGEVDGWTTGEVLLGHGVGPEPFYIVRLSDGQEVGYFAYSIGHP
jgi:hypothetical protein